MQTIPVYVGYDPREAAAYHVFCQSVLEHASVPVAFYPLHRPLLRGFDGQRDGTNAFIFSRYLVPYLQNFQGWAVFFDGDMVMREDIADLWALRDDWDKAVQVVKHDYRTRNPRKYVGSPLENDNFDYPRKNWSSVMLWNCGHYANRLMTPHFVAEAPGSLLHRFEWLKDSQVGELPARWNLLEREQEHPHPALIHYTCGVPGFHHYARDPWAHEWHETLLRTIHVSGESATGLVTRAERA